MRGDEIVEALCIYDNKQSTWTHEEYDSPNHSSEVWVTPGSLTKPHLDRYYATPQSCCSGAYTSSFSFEAMLPRYRPKQLRQSPGACGSKSWIYLHRLRLLTVIPELPRAGRSARRVSTRIYLSWQLLTTVQHFCIKLRFTDIYNSLRVMCRPLDDRDQG